MNNRYTRARHVLACRCGKSMSPSDMCWKPMGKGNARALRPIVCLACFARTLASQR